MKIISFIIVLFFFCISFSYAQMEVTPGTVAPFTPENLITNVFLGDGVEVQNVTFTGDPSAVGYFQNASGDIGMERGIVMSSGLAEDAPGLDCPNNCGNTGVASSDTSGGGDPDLQTTANGFNINDAAIYEITFVPLADTLQFNYVFGSEEYQNYTCSNFNDAFGFYISGPGINGTFSNNAENIALVPGTNLPVTINTVNSGTATGGPASNCVSLAYSQYFVDNIGNTGLNVEYSGYTKVFTATAVVIPCQTYTIKLAIGDASDAILDSGVFLEAKSFGTGSLSVEATTVSIDGTISEGCSDAVLSFSLPAPTESDLPLTYTIGGTATNGVDYTFIPDDLMIPAGEDSIAIVLQGIEDNITEGIETFQLIVQTDVCFFDTIDLKITENQLVPPNLDDLVLCNGDNAQIDASIPVFIPDPVTFTNTNTTLIDQIDVPFEFPINVSGIPFETIEEGVIQSVCIDVTGSFTSDLLAYLVSPGGQILELTTVNGGFVGGGGYFGTCFTETASTAINYNPNGSNYAPSSSVPFTGNWQPEGVWSDLYGGPTNGTWTLIVYDDVAGFALTYNEWSITFNNAYFINYEWEPPLNISCADCPDPIISPTTDMTYTVTITDSYGCSTTDEFDVTIVNQLPAPILSCGSSTSSSVTVEWLEVAGATSYEVSVNGGTWESPNPGPLSHTVTGLNLNEVVTIEVRAISTNCGVGLVASIDCTAQPCGLTTNLDATTDISCFGADDGTATLSSSSNAGTVTYDIGIQNNTTGIFSNLSVGDYTVTISDADCSLTETFTINEPNIIAITPTITHVTCANASDGEIDLLVTGGTPNFSYQWSNGITDTDNQVTGLSGGTYTVTVTDMNSCTRIENFVINENLVLTVSTSTTDATCDGLADGSVTVTANGGSSSYTYLWSANANNQNTATASNISTGTYTVTVTDSDGCSITISDTVTSPTSINTSTSSTPASCSGSTDGTATVTASGGAGNFTYLWGDNQMTATANNLTNGWHYVTVTDLNGCFVVDSAEVTVPNPIILNISGTDVLCNNGNTGTAMVVASGGAGNFTYLWNDANASTTSNISNLIANTYIVTVSDANGCSTTESIMINEPTALNLSISSTLIECYGDNTGTATIIATGGSNSYNYSWNIGGSNDNITGLTAGFYTVTVTDSNACSNSETIEVLQQTELTSSISVGGASCNGGGDGTATVSPSGGTSPYTYLWNDANSTTTATASNLAAQTYTVTITDDYGCTTTNFIDVAQPPAVSVSVTPQNISCFGGNDGSITALGNGGSGGYTYAWTGNLNGESINNLNAGTYTVTVSDSNNCTATNSVTLTEPLEYVYGEIAGNISCNGGNDGFAGVYISQGTYPYTYQWSTNQEAYSLASIWGLWSLDQTGCITYVANNIEASFIDTICINSTELGNTFSTYAVVSVGSPNQCAADMNDTDGDGICDALDSDINNPCIPNSFDFNNNGTCDFLEPEIIDIIFLYPETGNGDTECITLPSSFNPNNTEHLFCSQDDGHVISNLSVGTYTVTITDFKGCTATEEITLTEPAPLNINLSPTDVSCFMGSDGSIDASITGGTGSYSYEWSNNMNVEDINNIPANTYTITVTDENLCTATSSIVINQPTEGLTVSMSNDQSICFGASNGNATATPQGGAGNYTYLWSNGLQTPTINNLIGNTYTVTVTDNNGCTNTGSVTIQEQSQIVGLINTMSASCNNSYDGSATITNISGGAGAVISDYQITWGTNPIQNTVTAQGLQGGQTYFVTLTDANNCTSSQSVTIPNPSPVVVNLVNSIPVSCHNGTDASITVVGAGGTAPYSYEWSNNQTGDQATNLSPGVYIVTITDAGNCIATSSYAVDNPPSLGLTMQGSDVICSGESNGIATVLTTGGQPPYSYLWSTGEMTDTIFNVIADDYYVTVTDANGCLAMDSITINGPSPLIFSTTSEDVSCFGDIDGLIEVEASGGTYPYTYSIDGENYIGAGGFPGLSSDFYTVYVQDANGCITTEDSVYVGQPGPVEVIIYPDTSVVEMNLGDSMQLSIDYFNTVGEVNITWSGLYGSDSISCTDCIAPWIHDYENNIYSVTIIDENGCTAEDEIRVNVPRVRDIFVPSGFTPNADEMNDVLMVHGTSGTKILTFRVYDRWGELVFRADDYMVNATDPSVVWDGIFKGSPMNPGVFVWYVEAEYIDGRTESFKGNTTLIR